MEMPREYIEKLANRVFKYSDPYDEDSTFDNTLEAVQNNPIHVIEFLLDMLDMYTMEV